MDAILQEGFGLNAIGKSTPELTAIKTCYNKPLEPAQILTSSQWNRHLAEDKSRYAYLRRYLENLCVLCVKQISVNLPPSVT